MAEETVCPQCGAVLEVTHVGKLQDKFMTCPYCGYKVDVPDQFEVTTSEETIRPDGSRRRVETTHRRVDMGSNPPLSATGGGEVFVGDDVLEEGEMGPEAMAAIFQRLKEQGKIPQDSILLPNDQQLDAGNGPEGAVRSTVEFLPLRDGQAESSTTSFELTGAEAEAFLAQNGQATDMQAIREALAKGSLNMGKEHVVTTRIEEEYSTTDGLFPDAGKPASSRAEVRPSIPGRAAEDGGIEATDGLVRLVKWLIVLALIILAIVYLLRH